MSLDTTDAETIRKKCVSWDASATMKYGTLLYQMGGRPGVDPYGWREDRTRAAIADAVHFGFVEIVELLDGPNVRARP